MSETRWKTILRVALAVGVLAGSAALYASSRPEGAEPALPEPASAQTARYHCPMHPTMVSDRPGDCPICGMRLVPIETQEDHGSEVEPAPGATPVEGRNRIRISEGKRQLIGVRSVPVERKRLVRTVHTVGRVTTDETRLHQVNTKVAGWVEQLYANATGELVKEKEPLLTLYSPELVASAQEYLIALRGRERVSASTFPSVRNGADQLLESTRRRLLLFDLTPRQIDALAKDGEVPRTMTLFAPSSGTILARNVTQGQRIEAGSNLLEIADLSEVWVLADIYEYELPFIQSGQAATMTLSYLPGRRFEGHVTLVYPVVSESTRTVKVRLEFPNPDGFLKPEMYAEVEVRSDLGEGLVVPESAVISSGERDIAFVDQGDGYFEPREIGIGVRLSDEFEVRQGLAEGERVVVSGNFLVDSESKLAAAVTEAAGGSAGSPAGHTH